MFRPPRPLDTDGDAEPALLTRTTAIRLTRAVLKRADAAFAAFSCPATAECCQLAKTNRPPWLWPAEWAVLEERLRRDKRLPVAARPDGACPLLDAAGTRCTVYEDRPTGCRTYFCHRVRGPARQPVEAVDGLQRKLADLSARMGSDESAQPIQAWLAAKSRSG